MSEETIAIALTPRERQMISALRDIPPSPLRDLCEELIERLFEFVREPHCPEMQADGVPCSSASADCEQCARVRTLLETLRSGLTTAA